jgi:hypothetical protein
VIEHLVYIYTFLIENLFYCDVLDLRSENDDYEDFPVVPPLLRLSFNMPEDEYFKTPGKRYRK